VLHRRRKRLEKLARREAEEGASFWTSSFDETVRTKIVHAFRDAAGGYDEDYASFARNLILRDEGLMYLTSPTVNHTYDLLNFVMQCDDDFVPTVVEAMLTSFAKSSTSYGSRRWEAPALFRDVIAVVLLEHRVNYDLIDDQMVEFSSREMHESVMVPTLTLLAGRTDLAAAEAAYRDALDEISKGKPGDAITDAGTALQETLLALGCSGNALGPLIKSAKGKGLLARHDSPLLDAVEKTMHWVSADRSESGDAHQVADASSDDAWFIVHIVGAVILRLAQGGPRAARSA
jgi:hypothetical protein